jgi:hypothetical protein
MGYKILNMLCGFITTLSNLPHVLFDKTFSSVVKFREKFYLGINFCLRKIQVKYVLIQLGLQFTRHRKGNIFNMNGEK